MNYVFKDLKDSIPKEALYGDVSLSLLLDFEDPAVFYFSLVGLGCWIQHPLHSSGWSRNTWPQHHSILVS